MLHDVHCKTYALGIIGYLIIMMTFMGFNVLLLIRPEFSMQAGVIIIFYGLYYGVLGRDCAELCADKMAAKMGVRELIDFTISFIVPCLSTGFLSRTLCCVYLYRRKSVQLRFPNRISVLITNIESQEISYNSRHSVQI